MFAASKTAKAASAAAATDPQFNYVTMLLHGDGTNGAQNNTFLDSSTNNFTITRNGNTTQGTYSPYGSNWSNYFDGSGDYLTLPDNAAWNMGSGDFTAEAWIYPTSFANEAMVMGQWSGDTGGTGLNWALMFSSGSTGYLRLITSSNGSSVLFDLSTSTFALSLNTWQHIAAVRNGTTFTIYVNGVSRATTTNASSLYDATNSFTIGAESNTQSQYFTGYISNARVVKGTAVYTSAFTPSTTPLTAITNTSLLTCADNRFIDDSTNNFTITRNGDVSVQRFSPFAPSAPYSTSVIGGSGYFDGSGDYLNTPTSGQFAPTGNFTVSFWYYPTTLNTYNTVIGNYTSTASTDWFIEFTSNGSVNVYTNGGTVRITGGAGTIKSGQWSFVTLSRSGTTITFKVNGTSVGTYTQSGTFGSASKTIYVGQYFTGSEYITGYLSDVRLIDGSEVTTIPTSPLTAVSGTNLLLNFTNAGILDNAMMNDLETVGNAQISTSVKKYGTGSMAFDGTGDYLMSIANQSLELGSGDYTLECWVNISAAAANGGIISKGPIGNLTNTTWSLEFNGSANTVSYYVYNANNAVYIINGTSNIKTSTWIHLAICRSGNNTRLFVNGTQEGSTYTSGYTISAGDNLYIGGGFYAPTTRTITGYIDDLRITKYARYTSTFTPPTQAFPNN
jgi:hypothetical protein